MTDFPYVGLIQQEKEISESLVSMPLDYLRQNHEAFDDIVGILMASHIDVGRAYITEENEAPFLEFSRRLPVDRPRFWSVPAAPGAGRRGPRVDRRSPHWPPPR